MTRSRKRPSAVIRELLKQLTARQIPEEMVESNGTSCIRGYTPVGQRQQLLWRFLEKDVNYVDAGSVHHGDFIARIICCYPIDLSLIAWRASGASEDYQRMAKLTSDPLPLIQLNSDDIADLPIERGDLVEFSAKITVRQNMAHFEIGGGGLTVLGFEEPGDGETHGS
jgi:hypothetical protein